MIPTSLKTRHCTALRAVDAAAHNPAFVLAIILGCYLMIILDVSVVITALPSIHRTSASPPPASPGSRTPTRSTFGGLLLLGARAGRHPRPPPGLRRRHRPLHLRLDARRPRPVAGLAARRPRPAGRRRRDRRPVDPRPAHDQLPRGPRAHPRGRLVQRRRRRRRQRRPACSAACSTTWVSWRWGLFINVPIGVGADLAGAALPARDRAPQRPLRPRRRR